MKKLMKYTVSLILCTMALSANAFGLLNFQPKVNVSFVQTSQLVSLSVLDADASMYKMTLTKVNPTVTYFSDRPNRVIGQLGVNNYLSLWQKGRNSFNKDLPNAVLSSTVKVNDKWESINVVMELSNPHYHPHTQSFTYTVHVLSSDSTIPLNQLHYQFGTLFIDQVCLSCIGGGNGG